MIDLRYLADPDAVRHKLARDWRGAARNVTAHTVHVVASVRYGHEVHEAGVFAGDVLVAIARANRAGAIRLVDPGRGPYVRVVP